MTVYTNNPINYLADANLYLQVEQMYRKMMFNVLAKNWDDHTKKFASRLKKDHQREVTPAYEVCHAYKPEHRWVSEHALSINGKRTGITKDDLVGL